jgi:ribonuclease I
MTGSDALARHSSHKHADRDAGGPRGSYDYYVMALSWSPTFCQTHPDEDEQCGHKGYGFVLHGLWPQYEGGNGPQRCASEAEPDRRTVHVQLTPGGLARLDGIFADVMAGDESLLGGLEPRQRAALEELLRAWLAALEPDAQSVPGTITPE